ncbi:excinuclease ABC subunit UvrC [Myroides odoratimimus]|uniref:excinuclease ABC subunit UvrC n=1 Tax=Myroides odoratimimus TaxID=76832 RepID=UPI000280A98F|nr:excinuclease ABC subunit UvrC [Myroides odoratimimus]EKB04522.1 UvrABC system protein C [Myroides odoratimimus CCUG 3837]EPH10530.1 UvrABC system protein C [Myroides odoratimimus CCUG 12700]MCA4791476.1 excinuclease ABC subunit UvrC [Myroides odoratimimus]MCA4804965.1 excinuclease ABC subunit UvrC [Myroides odoratimimus]MCA4818736.1 excinuclease ABC subunit UvrC [Myroides odoratimimus]
MQVSPSLAVQIQTLPDQPGVYQYYDKDDKILYVGKAKNLKKRVSSYFNKIHDNAKTNVLVKKIVTIKHIVVPTETDALLLENNLIKQLQPRYNVLLKDDKSYPWICIKKEPFPRVFTTRRMVKDGSEYFGPYTSIKTVHTLIDLIKELYPLRTCNLDLTTSNVRSGKYKVCLEYHIGNCGGPCEERESDKQYDNKIRAIRDILKGNFKESLKEFKDYMMELASNMEFEEAQKVKDKIDLLENYQSKSTIVSSKISNVDVFSIISDEGAAYVNFLQVSYGAIIRSHTMELKKKLDETDEELLELAITELRERFHLNSKEIIVPFDVEVQEGIHVTVPKLGDKKKLLDLSERNAKYYRIDQLKQIKIVDPERHVNRIMTQMKKDLRMHVEPRHIECFDNSNIQGTNPVSACVVFKDGKPSKKDYRHFNVKTVDGPNDYDTMEEIVYRRYKRVIEEGQPLPDLIVIDGGKGQLGVAVSCLERLGIRGKVAIISLAERLEEIFYPGDSVPLYLDKRSETMKVIIHLRDEAHRFGLTFHRNQRSKNAITSELDGISGVGEKTKTTLMNHFKSTKRIKEASLEDLEKVIGKSKGKLVFDFFQVN